MERRRPLYPTKRGEDIKMKKLLVVVLAIMLVCGGMMSASQATAQGPYEYRLLADGTVEITHVSDDCTDSVIPGELDGRAVSSIANDAFSGCLKLKDVVIPEGVTSVGNNAFKDMSSTITSLALPSTVTEIGDYAFAGMNNRKFNTLVLPNTIIRIGAHAFDGASYLQTIHFGSTLEEIGDYAFNGCTRVKQMTCLAEITPNVGTDGLTSINSLAELYVPNEYLFDYQIDSNWSRFVLKPYGATETTVTDNDVAVVADDNTATFTWPTSNTADSYTIDITKDGVLFCQLTFNANGQLTGIAFAPGRDRHAHAPAAIMTAKGMQFTVTGLNSATHYNYTLQTKDANDNILASYSGEFTTTGVATAIDNIDSSSLQGGDRGRLILHDGQIFILREGKMYNAQGVEVK
jgi:hemin uptake protein HemP